MEDMGTVLLSAYFADRRTVPMSYLVFIKKLQNIGTEATRILVFMWVTAIDVKLDVKHTVVTLFNA